MKKYLLALGLVLMLVCWGWQGDLGVGTAPAIAQPPPPPGYCDPYYYNCTYNNYYTAPYTDPATQFSIIPSPQIGGALIYERGRHGPREYRRHERRERWEHGGGHH
ncbi:MAG: hypothetical protein M1438_14895 [Deltaproteobacteria bacterium]|nr:hypothetical protein [Deltaproteobacteria bacterium]